MPDISKTVRLLCWMERCLFRELQYGAGICLANTTLLHVVDIDPELPARLVLFGQIVFLGIGGLRIRDRNNHVARKLAILALDPLLRSNFADTLECVLVGIERLPSAVFAEC